MRFPRQRSLAGQSPKRDHGSRMLQNKHARTLTYHDRDRGELNGDVEGRLGHRFQWRTHLARTFTRQRRGQYLEEADRMQRDHSGALNPMPEKLV